MCNYNEHNGTIRLTRSNKIKQWDDIVGPFNCLKGLERKSNQNI